MGRMPLALLVGPANAGKVARLLDLYLADLDREPFLVVPNRADVERVERELIARAGGLLGGQIGTFDSLFGRVLANAGAEAQSSRRPVLGPLQRSLLLQRVVGSASLNGLGPSARFPGFADSLAEAVSDLESALLAPEELDGDLAALYSAYRAELDRLGVWDPELERALAAELVGSDLSAWDGTPVLAYGFEDMTGAQWTLLEALAARAEVTVSLPYEPGRAAFASLERTAADLARLADGRVEELPAQRWYDAPPLAYLERTLFTEAEAEPPPLDGAVRFLEAAGSRAVLELVGEDILALLRDGTQADEIAVVCPSVERVRATARDRLHRARNPVRPRGPRASRTDPLRPRATRPPPLRVAGRRSAGALLVPPLALLGVAAGPCRLRRRSSPRPGRLGARARRGGDQKPARPRDPGARRPPSRVRELSARARPCARRHDAPGGLRARAASGRRGRKARPARPRSGLEAGRRARRVGEPRRCGGPGDRRRGARARARASARNTRSGPRRGPRPRAREDAALSGRLPGRAGGGNAPAAGERDTVPPRRGAGRARERGPEPPSRSTRPARARPLPLLHGVHARLAAADARARGRDRRRPAQGGEPVLGRGPLALPARRGGAVDAPSTALGALLGARPGADGARAAALRGLARGLRRRRGPRARVRERLGAADRARPVGVLPADSPHATGGARRAT